MLSWPLKVHAYERPNLFVSFNFCFLYSRRSTSKYTNTHTHNGLYAGMRILYCLKQLPKIQFIREHCFSLTKTNGERERERDQPSFQLTLVRYMSYCCLVVSSVTSRSSRCWYLDSVTESTTNCGTL